MSIEDQVLQALARGYTHEENCRKVLDADLILAMRDELMPLISQRAPTPCAAERGADLPPLDAAPQHFEMYDKKGPNT